MGHVAQSHEYTDIRFSCSIAGCNSTVDVRHYSGNSIEDAIAETEWILMFNIGYSMDENLLVCLTCDDKLFDGDGNPRYEHNYNYAGYIEDGEANWKQFKYEFLD